MSPAVHRRLAASVRSSGVAVPNGPYWASQRGSKSAPCPSGPKITRTVVSVTVTSSTATSAGTSVIAARRRPDRGSRQRGHGQLTRSQTAGRPRSAGWSLIVFMVVSASAPPGCGAMPAGRCYASGHDLDISRTQNWAAPPVKGVAAQFAVPAYVPVACARGVPRACLRAVGLRLAALRAVGLRLAALRAGGRQDQRDERRDRADQADERAEAPADRHVQVGRVPLPVPGLIRKATRTSRRLTPVSPIRSAGTPNGRLTGNCANPAWMIRTASTASPMKNTSHR